MRHRIGPEVSVLVSDFVRLVLPVQALDGQGLMRLALRGDPAYLLQKWED